VSIIISEARTMEDKESDEAFGLGLLAMAAGSRALRAIGTTRNLKGPDGLDTQGVAG
jgi:hypothetical protein